MYYLFDQIFFFIICLLVYDASQLLLQLFYFFIFYIYFLIIYCFLIHTFLRGTIIY